MLPENGSTYLDMAVSNSQIAIGVSLLIKTLFKRDCSILCFV